MYPDGERSVEKRWNEVFVALSAAPRREIVVSLVDAPSGHPVGLPEAAVRSDASVDHDAVRRDLYHNHLPKLAAHEFVEWETDPMVARRGPRFEEVATVVRSLHSTARSIPEPLVGECQRLVEERRFA